MGLESGSFIKDLVATNPQGTDPKSQGDDHLRLVKSVLQSQFSGFTDGIPVTLTETELNGLPADIALKAPINSPALTGVPTAPTAAPGTNTTQVATTAFVSASFGNQKTQLLTAQPASGTSIDFTGIPSWAKKITVMLNGVSVSGASVPIIQLGAGSVKATGYSGSAITAAGTASNSAQFTTGFGVCHASVATASFCGAITLSTLGASAWAASGTMGRGDSNVGHSTGGTVTLSGTIDRIRLTTVNGTDTFDAGTVNILVEGY